MVVNVHMYFHVLLLTYPPHSPQVRVTRSSGVAVRSKRKAQYRAQVDVCSYPSPNCPPNDPPNCPPNYPPNRPPNRRLIDA